MKSIWLYLIYSTIVASILPVFRFRKTHLFYFFLTCALIDPIIIILSQTFLYPTYYFFPFTTVVTLFALPAKNTKYILVSLLSTIILIPKFGEYEWIPLLISSLNAFFIIEYFSKEIIKEYKNDGSVSLYLLALWLNCAKDSVKIYLYYRHNHLFIQFYTGFLFIGFAAPLLVAYCGMERKYYFRKISRKQMEENITPADSNNEISFSENHIKQIVPLSKRELEILALISTGLKQNQIAERLFIQNETVYFHTGKIRSKLNIESTSALAQFAFERKDAIGERLANYKTAEKKKTSGLEQKISGITLKN